MLPTNFLIEIADRYRLTIKEREVFLKKFGSDKSDRVIAGELHIADGTFRTRMSGVYRKFGYGKEKGPVKSDLLFRFLTKEYQKSNFSPVFEASNESLETGILVQEVREKVRQNLPQPDYGQFIGREQELALVKSRLLPQDRAWILTIDGIGGIGKSALALEVAHGFLRYYNSLLPEERFDAIIWTSAKRTVLTADSGIISRRQISRTLNDICKTIAITLDIEEQICSQLEDTVKLVCRELTQQRTLLIVDNLETVDDECVIQFLRELPTPTKAIATTRHWINFADQVRLRGMPWKDAEMLIEQECDKKATTLTEEQHRKLFDRTGGVPLAIVWTVATIGFGYSVDTVLARLGSRKSDIARFCFEETVERIRERDAYKLLLALALCKGDASREELGYVAGFGEDEFSRDDGLVELDKLSLVNKKGDRFSMLPLTKEYVDHELGIVTYFTTEAVRRLIEHHTAHYPYGNACQYLLQYRNQLSKVQIKEAIDIIDSKLWNVYQEATASNYYDPWYYSWYEWLQTWEAIGGELVVQKLESWISTIVSFGYELNPHYYCSFTSWEISGCINTLSNLKKYDSIGEILKKYVNDNFVKNKCIEVIEKSGNKELVQPLQYALSVENNEDVAAKLRQAIAKLEKV
jgi:LuxR family glucitol operon transcriptional activator